MVHHFYVSASPLGLSLLLAPSGALYVRLQYRCNWCHNSEVAYTVLEAAHHNSRNNFHMTERTTHVPRTSQPNLNDLGLCAFMNYIKQWPLFKSATDCVESK